MPIFNGPGKILIVLGLGLVVAGLLLSLIGKGPGEGAWSGWIGRLPGDLFIKRDRLTVYIPLGTCILVSVVGSMILYFFMKR
ncbi:MAG: DUF2905 domain-containing protein [Nitrospira sp.]|nr:DUF2905 domain-containing protein [Nitrospira sp.]MDD9860595.1 DUF2905 domain-containing protein [Nitrospira sp.]